MVGASACAEDDLHTLTCPEGETRIENACVLVCADGYEVVGDQCLEVCAQDWQRDGGSGDCVCADGYEMVADDCVPVCADSFVREADTGDCGCAADFVEISGVCVSVCGVGFVRNADTDVCEAVGGIEGQVCDANTGAWFEGVDVTILLADGTVLATVTAADGSFAIADIPPGQYYVEYTGPGGYVNTESVEIAPGATVTAGDATCDPLPGHLGGSVCDAIIGAWVEGAAVSIDAAGIAATTTDANGDFWFHDVPPGDYVVTVVYPGGATETRNVTVQAGQVIDVGPYTCAPVVDPCVDAPPVAAAGTDASALPNDTVALDGTGSSDPAGQALTYAWRIDQQPAGSAAALSDATVAGPTLTVDALGAYLVCLVVTDVDACASPEDCVAINVAAIDCTSTGPTALAGADVSAVPDETVSLDGSGSTDPGAQTLTYSWRVATRPTGSTATISDTTAATPTLLGDVSGDFEVCLTVTDIDGCASPEDCMTITVAPLVAFHIELIWDTDNTDIDLHYKRPGGDFLFAPLVPGPCGWAFGDAYFACMTPDWGPSGADSDATNNPRLDVDNMQGFGPENINQDILWDSGPYIIGVHFWGDAGGGTTTARVRVYTNGVLAYEASSPSMDCGDLWEVANVQVSASGTVVSITPNDTYTVDKYTAACPP